MKSYRFLITGKVQGVYYRANIAKNAQEVGLSGYVRNLDDGRVEAAVSCEGTKLEGFRTILKKGSPRSHVENIELIEIEEIFSGDFVVRQ